MKKLIIFGIVLLFVIPPSEGQNSISGYVVALDTAEPIANATIFLDDRHGLPLEDSLRVTSDSTGFYRISGVKAGTYIINAWTTYGAMNRRYAMVLQSNRIKVDGSLNIDFVFSENALKYSLHFKYHPWEPFGKQLKRNSDVVARKAVRPQLYINSQRASLGAYFIENISNIDD